MSAPLKNKIKYKSAQQNMGENLVYIPHQILTFVCGNFWWSSEAAAEQQRRFLGNTWAID